MRRFLVDSQPLQTPLALSSRMCLESFMLVTVSFCHSQGGSPCPYKQVPVDAALTHVQASCATAEVLLCCRCAADCASALAVTQPSSASARAVTQLISYNLHWERIMQRTGHAIPKCLAFIVPRQPCHHHARSGGWKMEGGRVRE